MHAPSLAFDDNSMCFPLGDRRSKGRHATAGPRPGPCLAVSRLRQQPPRLVGATAAAELVGRKLGASIATCLPLFALLSASCAVVACSWAAVAASAAFAFWAALELAARRVHCGCVYT